MSDADDKKDDKTPKDDKKDDKTPPKSEIREVVTEVLGELGFTGGRSGDDKDKDDDDNRGRRRTSARGRGVDVDDIGAQVEAAVERVTAKSAAAKKDQEREDRIKALEEKTAKPERKPAEFRRATKWMWGDPDAD